ncbi:hypothetical protein BJY01DRAFT_223439 [Aspergillus pseudoustus]|uniref:C2H2-type domain-containing protein n=1 Tax=Aspergillus pseudoustus TaxID=1810923 RepID=A0ABR4J748_9EURO
MRCCIMSSNQVSSSYYTPWTVANATDKFYFEPPFSSNIEGDLSQCPPTLPNDFDPKNSASSSVYALPGSVPSSNGPTITTGDAHQLSYTVMLNAGLNVPEEPRNHHSIEFAWGHNIHSPRIPVNLSESTFHVQTARPTSQDTLSNGPVWQGASHAALLINPSTSLTCEWRGCTYTGTFSRPAQLRRHVDTQHIFPKSFACPAVNCDKTFNRKDNLRLHLRRAHLVDNPKVPVEGSGLNWMEGEVAA